jgi:hypothetical protein
VISGIIQRWEAILEACLGHWTTLQLGFQGKSRQFLQERQNRQGR